MDYFSSGGSSVSSCVPHALGLSLPPANHGNQTRRQRAQLHTRAVTRDSVHYRRKLRDPHPHQHNLKGRECQLVSGLYPLWPDHPLSRERRE